MSNPMDLRPTIRQSPPVDVTKPYDPSTLKGKVIVITGGANGLGESMVRTWASHGAHIVIGDIDTKGGEALVAELRVKHPEGTFAFQDCDVTDWDAQVSLFDLAVRVSPHGGIDVVVPNAGIIIPGHSMRFQMPEPDAEGKLRKPSTKTFDVNITGAMYTTHLALYHLPRNGRADRCILLLGSLASLYPFAGQTFYTMTKHAILGLFRTLRATSFAAGGVRVNLIAPYYIGGSNMLSTANEAAFLSGSAGSARIPDVIDTATRLIADESIAGRGLAVGPPLRTKGVAGVEDAEGVHEMVVPEGENGGEGRAVWEIYADDYTEVDSFVKRFVLLINAVARVKGWWGMLVDVVTILRRK